MFIPPKLSEPEGDWISFDTPAVINSANHQQTTVSSFKNPHSSITQTNYVKPSQFEGLAATNNLPEFVNQNGNNVPLYKAIRTIVPAHLGVSLAPDVASNFRGNVSWTGNDQWTHVLRKMLASHNLKAEVKPKAQEVVVTYLHRPVKTKPVLKEKTDVSIQKAQQGTHKSVFVAPVKEGKVLKVPIVPVVTTGKPKPLEVSGAVAALKPTLKPSQVQKPVLKVWTIDKGMTLKSGFSEWVAKETCPGGKGKWLVRWDTDTDYPIDYPLTFSGINFEDVTSQLFNLYRKAQAPLYVSGYRNQCFIVISDKK